MRNMTGSITRSLCDQIYTAPIHWTKATDFPETATHAIDFGPGGLSGVGPLSARNFDGRGIRVILVGDSGKGDAELYDSLSVKYEDWWSKKFAPSLVRTRYVDASSSTQGLYSSLSVTALSISTPLCPVCLANHLSWLPV